MFDEIKKLGLKENDKVYADVSRVLLNTKKQSIDELNKTVVAFVGNKVFVDHLQQTLDNVKNAGVPVDNQTCKSAEGVLQTAKQQVIDELNKALQVNQTKAIPLWNDSRAF